MSIPNLSEKINFFGHTPPFLLTENSLKNPKYFFLSLEKPLVATFSETRASTSRKYVAEQGIMMLNLSKKLQSFWLHSSVFALEK